MMPSQNVLIVRPEVHDYGIRFHRRLAPRHCYHISDLHVQPHNESGGAPATGGHKAFLDVTF